MCSRVRGTSRWRRRLFGCQLYRSSCLFAESHEFLGGARMDADGLVELPLGRTAFDRDRQPLDDLRRVLTEHMAAKHAIGLGIDDELDKGALVAARQGVLHRLEAGAVDVDLAMLVARLFLGQTDGPGRRLAEHRPGPAPGVQRGPALCV